VDGLLEKYKKGKFLDLCRKLEEKYSEHPAAFAFKSADAEL
jgi:hypothetical protein